MKLLPVLPAVLLAAGCAGVDPVPANPVPGNLKPASGESLKRVLPARGVQIYECRAGRWNFVAPEADLFDTQGNLVGRHYAGPQWEAADGSKVAGTVKSRAEAPLAGAIPWLLLDAKSVGGKGYFSDVTSIQRVSTVGGAAPRGGCYQEGERARVVYTADYYFFHR